jgi:hypothetical protein
MDTESVSKSKLKKPSTDDAVAHLQKANKNIDNFIVVTKNKKDSENESLHQDKLDSNCIIRINKRLVRVEYPGEVKNINKAVETLGGLESIESVSDSFYCRF